MPAASLNAQLAAWIEAGGARLGQIALLPHPDGMSVTLTHVDDAQQPAAALERLDGLPAIREWTRHTVDGELRPLKTSPDLRRGWIVHASSLSGLREVLECFYPGMVAAYFRHREGTASPVPVRETLARQTGMYRFAKNLSDSGLETLVAECCDDHHCLKRVLWARSFDAPLGCLSETKKSTAAPTGEMPLLCLEACFVLVAEARLAAKAENEAREEAARS